MRDSVYREVAGGWKVRRRRMGGGGGGGGGSGGGRIVRRVESFGDWRMKQRMCNQYVYVCVHVCVYICMYVCVCICICTYIHTRGRARIFACVCVGGGLGGGG